MLALAAVVATAAAIATAVVIAMRHPNMLSSFLSNDRTRLLIVIMTSTKRFWTLSLKIRGTLSLQIMGTLSLNIMGTLSIKIRGGSFQQLLPRTPLHC